MSLLTNWGYTLTTLEMLPDFITPAEFNAYTGNKYSGDTRIAGAIAAASQGIRDRVGWHLYPTAPCKLETVGLDKRITKTLYGLQIQLPARYVTAVSRVNIDGADLTNFSLETSGILRVYNAGCRLNSAIVIEYTAGLPEGLLSTIKDIAASRAVKPLAQTFGVNSETAGGVSISYNSAWASDTSASLLQDAETAALEPYRLRGLF